LTLRSASIIRLHVTLTPAGPLRPLLLCDLQGVAGTRAAVRSRVRSAGGLDSIASQAAPLSAHGLGLPARSLARHRHPTFPRHHSISHGIRQSELNPTDQQAPRRKGVLWQARFFNRALRAVKEYHEKVEYIHLNPVKRGLVTKPEEWKWSSIHDYT